MGSFCVIHWRWCQGFISIFLSRLFKGFSWGNTSKMLNFLFKSRHGFLKRFHSSCYDRHPISWWLVKCVKGLEFTAPIPRVLLRELPKKVTFEVHKKLGQNCFHINSARKYSWSQEIKAIHDIKKKTIVHLLFWHFFFNKNPSFTSLGLTRQEKDEPQNLKVPS